MLARAAGPGAMRARRLPVGGAYHSPLMAPAERDLAPLIRAAPLAPPNVTLVSSVTGTAVTRSSTAYREQLVGQITSPVDWQAVTTGTRRDRPSSSRSARAGCSAGWDGSRCAAPAT